MHPRSADFEAFLKEIQGNPSKMHPRSADVETCLKEIQGNPSEMHPRSADSYAFFGKYKEILVKCTRGAPDFGQRQDTGRRNR